MSNTAIAEVFLCAAFCGLLSLRGGWVYLGVLAAISLATGAIPFSPTP